MQSNTMKLRTLSWSMACGLAVLATTASAQGMKAGSDKLGGSRLQGPSTGAVAPAATTNASRSADFIVAVVNSEPVTNVEVQQYRGRLSASAEGSNAPHAERRKKRAQAYLCALFLHFRVNFSRSCAA